MKKTHILTFFRSYFRKAIIHAKPCLGIVLLSSMTVGLVQAHSPEGTVDVHAHGYEVRKSKAISITAELKDNFNQCYEQSNIVSLSTAQSRENKINLLTLKTFDGEEISIKVKKATRKGGEVESSRKEKVSTWKHSKRTILVGEIEGKKGSEAILILHGDKLSGYYREFAGNSFRIETNNSGAYIVTEEAAKNNNSESGNLKI